MLFSLNFLLDGILEQWFLTWRTSTPRDTWEILMGLGVLQIFHQIKIV